MFFSFIIDNITFQSVALSGIQQQDQQDRLLAQQWWFVLLIDTSYPRRVHDGIGPLHTSMVIKETSLDSFYSQVHVHVSPHECQCTHPALRSAWPFLRISADIKEQSGTPVEGPP